jgi:shikimate-5-dehydrogenase
MLSIEGPAQASLPSTHVDVVTSPVGAEVAKSAEQKQFHIFGNGISFSISPTIHNAGFSHHGLPCVYDIRESENIDGVAHLIQSRGFGGASVTMPHKLEAHKYCDNITDTAKLIGAVNTLIVTERDQQRTITGENTDWSGLYALLRSYIGRCGKQVENALVVGAGGASRAALYALHRAGVCRIFLVNRTQSTAEGVRDSFERVFDITVLPSLSEMVEKMDIVVGTVPANVTTEDQFRGIFKPEGLCIEMAYKPRVTPLLKVARSQQGWETVTGLDVLLAQAFDQYRLWTGKEPPIKEMIHAVAQREQDMDILRVESKLQ